VELHLGKLIGEEAIPLSMCLIGEKGLVVALRLRDRRIGMLVRIDFDKDANSSSSMKKVTVRWSSISKQRKWSPLLPARTIPV